MAKKRAKKKPKPRAKKKAPRRPKFDAPAAFARAVELATAGSLAEAKKLFRDIVTAEPKGPLAGDALYSAGLCSIQLDQFRDAIALFTRVIEDYPKAAIHPVAGAQEFGRTAARAHLGRLRAYLALGRRDVAQRELDELNAYPDSYVVDEEGERITYYALGLDALRQTEAATSTQPET